VIRYDHLSVCSCRWCQTPACPPREPGRPGMETRPRQNGGLSATISPRRRPGDANGAASRPPRRFTPCDACLVTSSIQRRHYRATGLSAFLIPTRLSIQKQQNIAAGASCARSLRTSWNRPRDFAVEIDLASRSLAPRIARLPRRVTALLVSSGFRIADLAVQPRVRARVRRGGTAIPRRPVTAALRADDMRN